jgi:cbb3-type cytochrome oxidase maturation protein
MSVFLILIPVSLALAIAFVCMCLASIRGGQFDDLESPRWRILFESAPVFEGAPEALSAGASEAALKIPRSAAPPAAFPRSAQSAIPARNIDDQG